MTEFNLRQLVRDTIRTSKSVEYADIAHTVLAAMSSEDYRAASAAMLPSYVRAVAASERTPGPVHPPMHQPTLASVGLQPESWKVTSIRNNWQARKEEIYATAHENKRLGDFTYEDLIFQSNLNQGQAKKKLAKAKGWRNLADLMRAEGVETVRELPAEMLMTTLGAVA